MKTNRLTLCLAVLFALMVTQSSNLYAGTFIQNACWTVSDEGEDPQPDDDLLVLGVTDIGGGHYGFNGYVLSQDGENEDSPQIFNGNGTILGGQLVAGLNGIQDDNEAVGSLSIYLRINLNDLSGTFQGVGTFYDKNDEVVVSDKGSGDLILSDCPA